VKVRDATVGSSGPATLRWLDAPNRADHLFLAESDQCAYLCEYAAGLGYRGGPCNQLLRNFKCEPTIARGSLRRAHYKRQAMMTLARWLRLAVPREQAEQWTWVPVPPSRQCGDPDFDDRLSITLSLAFRDYDLDLRRLLRQQGSTASDHAGRPRLPEQLLYRLLQVDFAALRERPVRQRIVVFDDVLTSGKHFKCCERRLQQCLPQTPVLGLFLMRRAPARSGRSLGRAW
jgi:hypothetical protein